MILAMPDHNITYIVGPVYTFLFCILSLLAGTNIFALKGIEAEVIFAEPLFKCGESFLGRDNLLHRKLSPKIFKEDKVSTTADERSLM